MLNDYKIVLVDSKPTIKKLLDHVIPSVTPCWYILGVKLLKEGQESHLNIIESNRAGDNKNCCLDMFRYWLDTNTDASWRQLIEALRSPAVELPVVAADIDKILTEQSQQEARTSEMAHEGGQDVVPVDQHTVQPEGQSNVSSATTISFAEFDTISEAFLFLTSRLRSLFAKTNFLDLKRSCIEQINTPSGAQLPAELVEKVKSCDNIAMLFEVLADSAYWSWIDVRLLRGMAAASGQVEAIKLLSNYTKTIFSKKLFDLLPNAPTKEVKEKYYTKIVTKINKHPNEITVADLIEFRSQLEEVLLDIKQGMCILEHLEKGCVEIHWYIPTNCIDKAYQTASIKYYQFHDFHLQYLKIGDYPVIHDPPGSCDLTISAPSPPVIVASVKDLINHYYEYLSVNMDARVITQLMVSQKLLSEEIVMKAFSDYHKNCLILQQVRLMSAQSLLLFVELLQSTNSQKYIGIIQAIQSSQLLSSHSDTQSAVVTATDDNYNSESSSAQALGSTRGTRKRSATYKVSIDIKYYKLSTRISEYTRIKHQQPLKYPDIKHKTEHFQWTKPSLVAMEFLDLEFQLGKMLQTCEPKLIIEKCISLLANDTHNIPLFPNEYAEKLKTIKHTSELIQQLSLFNTWDNHSVLCIIAEASKIPEATLLLMQFDDRIDLSQPLTSFPMPAPSYNMVPYNHGTHTVLAVRLDLELNLSTLQNIFDARSLIQDQCKLTSHCLHLLAVTKTTYTIVYWMIPRSIAHLITASAVQFQSYYQENGILQLAVYPGAMFCTESTLKVGPLSFLNQIEIDSKLENDDNLNITLSQVEELPRIISRLQNELTLTVERLTTALAQNNKKEMSDEDLSQYQLLMMQLEKSKALLEEKVVKEKQKYSDLKGKYEELQSIKSCSGEVKLLKQKVAKEKQNYSDLLRKYEDLQNSQSFGTEAQIKLTKLESTLETVAISLEKVKVIKKYWGDKGIRITELPSEEHEESKDLPDKVPILNKLKKLNTNLANIEDWSEIVQLIHTKLSDSKQNVDELESVLKKLEAKLQRSQEENKMISDEMSSQLMIKEKELTKLKEDKKLLVKQFRERKLKKRIETIPQDQLIHQELLGSGRYGEVYKISYNDKLYAGKIIYKKLLPGHPHSSPDQINEFMEEIENASAMVVTNQHPNIEQFYSVIQSTPNTPPILLTELLRENLNDHIARMKGKLPIHAQLDLCHDMAKGLRFLHTAGLVHNNLHGANILISQDGQAKIADYICPLVETLTKQTTQHNVYTSPELIKGVTTFPKKSDIYSLGVLCLQVTTQCPPVPKDSPELSNVQRWKEQLDQITTNPLLSLILQCLGMILARPTIDRVCAKLIVAKEKPQSVMSNTLHHIKDTTKFGAALQSGRHKVKWTKCANLPVPTRYARATVINDILYIGGGKRTIANDDYYIFSYKLTDDQWKRLPILPYCYGVPTNISNNITFIGGYDPSTSGSTNKVITLEDNKWTTKYPNMMVARLYHAAVIYQHYVIVAGGVGEDWSILDTIEVFNCNNYQWAIVSTHLPQPMKYINATTCNQSFIIAGYEGADGRGYSGTFIIAMDILLEHQQSLTSSTGEDDNKWSQLCPTPYWNTTIVPNTSTPVIIGGDKQGKTVNNISLYDDSSNSWRTVGSLPFSVARATVATINNTIIIAGGVTDGSSFEAINATTLDSVVLGQLELCD